MKYHIYIKRPEDNYVQLQEEIIYEYTRCNNIPISQEYRNENTFSEDKIENYIDLVIDELSHGDRLIIATLNILGNSSKKIIERIRKADQKFISIYLVRENVVISHEYPIPFSLIDSLFLIDNHTKHQRLATAKESRKKNGTKLGRKSGKKTKSMFDKHKRKIMKLYKQGVPKTKILAELKQEDEILKNSSPQALGQYIKKVKLKKEKQYNSLSPKLIKDTGQISFEGF